ncbi:hypothetical protein F5Y09DRAFT_348154 [Xylaria sp. FL1042]|nr:hypothetical protein F5Y09DRAFT_348154 [Xylaria sp. FL1042]
MNTNNEMDFYTTLGVPSNADTEAIEKAFRKLALKYHPDKANKSSIPAGETEANKKIREERIHQHFARKPV